MALIAVILFAVNNGGVLAPARTAFQRIADRLIAVGWALCIIDVVGSPFRSASWRGAVAVVLDRCGGELGRVRRMGPARFEAAVRREAAGV